MCEEGLFKSDIFRSAGRVLMAYFPQPFISLIFFILALFLICSTFSFLFAPLVSQTFSQ